MIGDNPEYNRHSPGLISKLTQRLEQRLSPQMVLAMKILQLPVLDLQLLVKEELEINPTLEIVEESITPPEKKTEDSPDKTSEEGEKDSPESDPVEVLDSNRESTYDSSYATTHGTYSDKKWEAVQNVAVNPLSLQDYLYQQFNLLETEETDREIARNIIYNINNDGYFSTSPEEIAQSTQANVEKVNKILRIIQQFDPPGVGARNLQECLLLQLMEDEPNLNLKKQIINNHLEDIKNNQIPKIASQLEISLEELKPIIQDLMRLNPHPGMNFSRENVPEIIPDVIVKELGNGGYDIKLNTDYIPQLRISQYYQRILSNPETSRETRAYIRKKIEFANQIIRAIRLRQNTLLRIAEDILKTQKDFFENGLTQLRPLKMQEIATRLGIHVTTVSRAISGRSSSQKQDANNIRNEENRRSASASKYMDTPWGVFSMKFFFSRAADTSSGESQSNKVVLMTIKELIEQEDKSHPLSDDEIINLLKQKGINVARRTVAKYRQGLNIPASRIRKQY